MFTLFDDRSLNEFGIQNFIEIARVSGLLDAETGPAHTDVQHPHVHRRRAFRRGAPGKQCAMGLEGGVRAKKGRRHIRVSGEHRAQDQLGRATERRR